MLYSWIPNITCSIVDGRAYFNGKFEDCTRNSGACYDCSEFRGVDLADTGKALLSSCCRALQMPASQR